MSRGGLEDGAGTGAEQTPHPYPSPHGRGTRAGLDEAIYPLLSEGVNAAGGRPSSRSGLPQEPLRLAPNPLDNILPQYGIIRADDDTQTQGECPERKHR